jgi:hypothetical protein
MGNPRVVITGHSANEARERRCGSRRPFATGDYLLIFDADLEYSADDILGLLAPVLRGDDEVVRGSASSARPPRTSSGSSSATG